MPDGGWLLLTWMLTLASWIVIHVAVLHLVLRADALERRWKAWALVPPLTPFVAWHAGRRTASILWWMAGVLYVVLRALE